MTFQHPILLLLLAFPIFYVIYYKRKGKAKEGTLNISSKNIISKKTDKIVFCDTDLLTTATYSKLYFNNYCDPLLDKYSKLNYYDLYLLMDIDIPWVKDDLRDRPNERDIFFNSFKMALERNNKNYFTVADFTVYFFNKFLSGSGSIFTGSKVYLAE